MQTTIEGPFGSPFGSDVSCLRTDIFSTLYPHFDYTYKNGNDDCFYERVITYRRFFYQIPKQNRSKRKTKQTINELS